MLGIPEGDPLPIPADSAEIEGWNLDMNPDNAEIEEAVQPELSTNNQSDPAFPYPDGPGHKDATPQQLSVIWNIMNACHVKSFRPNFAEASTTKGNKFLWNIAENSFIKLVESGEYVGVSLEKENRGYIKKCFASYIQTLTKRFGYNSLSDFQCSHIHRYPSGLVQTNVCFYPSGFVKRTEIVLKRCWYQKG